MKRFGITGVAGYIAPRHLKAIRDTGNILVAAADPHDSVGILDQYFPEADFFTEIERFDRHLEKLKREGDGIEFLSICTPNNLHDAHIRLALRNGADAICEKPIVLNPWNLDLLEKLEIELGRKVFTVLQLRVHPSLVNLKEKICKELILYANRNINKKYNVELNYITSRGKWYDYSWKGEVKKSGGVATNIGVHFFDLLIWLFGSVEKLSLRKVEKSIVSGELELKHAFIKWNLSIDKNDLPKETIEKGKTTFRSIKIDDEEAEFSEGFTDLHTKVYQEILNGKGFGINEARASIELVSQIRCKI